MTIDHRPSTDHRHKNHDVGTMTMMRHRHEQGMITRLVLVAVLLASTTKAFNNPAIAVAFSTNRVKHHAQPIISSIVYQTGHQHHSHHGPRARVRESSYSRQSRTSRRNGIIPSSMPLSNTALSAASPSSSIISSSNNWGNVAVLSFAASLAQLLGKTTLIGKLLGAPVTAMALTFAASSVGWIPTLQSSPLSSPSTSSSSLTWSTILPPGGSTASTFLQSISLTLATPLLLLGTSLRGTALQQCGSLLGSFVIASFGTLLGAVLAFALSISDLNIRSALLTSLGGDGIKIAAALLAKNIGGGINYMAVCSCLGASSEAVAAGLCVDNVMALVYFPMVSVLASKYGDVVVVQEKDDEVEDEDDVGGSNVDVAVDNEDGKYENNGSESSSPIEALSHAFTLAAILTALGQFCNSKLHLLSRILGRTIDTTTTASSSINLSLPITTLLAVLFSAYYPPNRFLSPTTTTTSTHDENDNGTNDMNPSNAIAKAGETLGTSLLYLFFATAGAPGWRLKDSIQRSFPPIASFLVVLYGIHGAVLWGAKTLVDYARTSEKDAASAADDDDDGTEEKGFWRNVVAPQRLLVASSAAIGGPATAAALAKSFEWESLLTPSLLVGNVGYAVATFIGLIFYGVFR